MCHLSKKDQYVCQSNHGIAEAVMGVLGGAQFPSGPFYHPRSSRCRFGPPREAAVCAGNFPDSNGISDDFKRQKRSHQTEPVPSETSQRQHTSRGCLVNSIFMRRGAPWGHESSVAHFTYVRLQICSPSETQRKEESTDDELQEDPF